MVLRPLIYCAEADLAKFADAHAVPDHPLRPLRQPGRAAAQRHEGDARRYRAAHAGPQGHDDPRARQCPALASARPQAVRLRRARARADGGRTTPMRFDDRDIDWLCGAARRRGDSRDHAALPPAGRGRRPPEDLGHRPGHRGGRQCRAGHHRGDRRPLSRRAGRRRGGLRRSTPSLLPRLGGADLAFVVDPVDGTFNFASGLPLFGVMLAVVVRMARRSPASSTIPSARTF